MFPLRKAAYDDNAALALNAAPGCSSCARACPSACAPQCVGVRLAFARTPGELNVRLRKAEGEALALPVVDGAAFSDDPNDSFRTVEVRFDGARGQVVSASVLVAIAAAIETRR